MFFEAMIKGGHLQEFVDIMPFGAYFKDASTGRYLVTNKTNAAFFNCVPEEIVGKKFSDFRGTLLCGEDYFQLADDTDKKACEKGKIFQYESRNFIDHKGVAYHSEAFKIPFLRNGKANLILAVFTNSEPMMDILEILAVHVRYYKNQKTAVYNFLDCHQLAGFFCKNSLPTVLELKSLFAYARTGKVSLVSEQLGMHYQTVYSRMKSVENKARIDFEDLVEKARALQIRNPDRVDSMVSMLSCLKNNY